MFFKKKKKNKKQHLLPRLIVGIFMAIAVAQTVATIGAFSSPEMASAASEKLVFTPQVEIGTMKSITLGDSTRPIAEYIKAIYTYAVGAVGILATVMLMIGGLRWILAAGNPSSVSEAKDIIMASISGMVLVLTSYLVINQVNPSLTDLSKNITTIKSVPKKEDLASGPSCAWESAKTVATGVGDTTGQRGKTGCDDGKLEGEEKSCTNKRPEGEANCCCSYQKKTNCEWSNTSCAEGKTSYEYSIIGSKKDENAVKNCGSDKQGGDSFCCCEPRACPTCVSLKDSGMCSPQAQNCETKESFAEPLKTAYSKRGGLNWYVTSGTRKADQMQNGAKSNHLDGNAVDISIENISVLETAQNLYTSLKENLPTAKIYLECSQTGCCENYPETNCRVVTYATSIHFHVDAPSVGASASYD